MSVVFDTNIWISAFLSPKGSPAELISLWENELFDVTISPPLLSELTATLNYQKIQKHANATPRRVEALQKKIKLACIYIQPGVILRVVEADDADNRVLACAVAAEATFIICGDTHLLTLRNYQGIEILMPANVLLFQSRR